MEGEVIGGLFALAFIAAMWWLAARNEKAMRRDAAAAAKAEQETDALMAEAHSLVTAVKETAPGFISRFRCNGADYAVVHYEDLQAIAQRGGVTIGASTEKPFVWRPK